MKCDDKKLLQLASGELSESEQLEVEVHLDHCEECQAAITDFASPEADWTLASKALQGYAKTSSPALNENPAKIAVDQPTESVLALVGLLPSLAPSDDPASAGRIGQFEVLGIVGSGGMGIVLKAREPALDRIVAIKLLAPHLASSESAKKRFAREARSAASVLHDNVIEIYQVGQWHGQPFLVMPYLPGPTLQDYIQQGEPLSLEQILILITQLASGLAAAHSQGMVHRDVKPSNVLVASGTERAIITDFGLARTADDASLTTAGTLTGTPGFMSPEQARGDEIDQRSDLYSLGCVLFALTTGRPPIDCETGSTAIYRLRKNQIDEITELRSDLPTWFVNLVNWLLAYEVGDRPKAAEQVANVCERCLAHLRQPGQN